MQKCISKDALDCILLTKDNKDEFLEIVEPMIGKNEMIMVTIDDEKQIAVKHLGWNTSHYYYNYWYVREDGWDFTRYTKDEFEEYFELKTEN